MTQGNVLIEGLAKSVAFLMLLLAADMAFALIHLVHTLSDALPDPGFSLSHDLGYSEIFQYVKTFWVVLLLAGLWWRTRHPVYGAWMGLYTYLLGDDALQIHESGGAAVADALGYASRFGLRAVDFGELTISLVVGAVVFSVIIAAYLRSATPARHASQDLALLLSALVFFGVGFDMLHAISGSFSSEALSTVFGLIEDGGEMIAISATVWYLLALLACNGDPGQPLWRWVRSVILIRGPAPRPLTSGAVPLDSMPLRPDSRRAGQVAMRQQEQLE